LVSPGRKPRGREERNAPSPAGATQDNHETHPLAIVVTLAQSLLGLALVGTCVYLLLLSRGPESSGSIGIPALLLVAALFAPVALLVLLGAYGLARSRRWGWWVALVTDSALTFLWGYSIIDDGWRDPDWTLVAFAAGSLLPAVLLLVPAIRRYYWVRTQVQPPAATHV
jgi:uncharacterized membrane protein (DUF2068 family)